MVTISIDKSTRGCHAISQSPIMTIR